jgi:hypothetical protein
MNKTTMAAAVLAVALWASAGGCTKTVGMKVARHEVGGPPIAQPV